MTEILKVVRKINILLKKIINSSTGITALSLYMHLITEFQIYEEKK